MKKLRIDLEHCYGIKALKKEFDFSDKTTFAIYAPNGAMKSSFAQTFKDIAEKKPSKDRIFAARKTKRIVTDEAGADLVPEDILVIAPYDEVYGHTEKTSTLLVNAKLREVYEKLQIGIDAAQEKFLKALKKQSGSKRDLAKEISMIFTKTDNNLHRGLIRIRQDVASLKDPIFADVEYDTLFDDKVLAFLGTKDFKTAIEDYVRKYNELLSASTYFKKGTFTYYNAETIAKTLADNGFFDAKHTVSLNAGEKIEITSRRQLEELIAKEKEGISKDADLRKKFNEIDTLLKKNLSMKSFEAYLSQHEALLAKLSNMDSFRDELWVSYIKANEDLYNELLDLVENAAKRKKEIEDEAAKERTQWHNVIDIFNERFVVPFKLEAQNQISVVLGAEPILKLGFTFAEGGDQTTVEQKTLMESLSTGEKKAFYVLNVIFEIESRRQAGSHSLVIVDDIADSFDYKNKYAIIQYLKEIAEETNFKQIILTHNFDFFRTIQSRFVSYKKCLMAMKTSAGLVLEQATGIINPFTKDWKKHFYNDPKKRIACIPFMRNIAEYTRGETNADYLRLTSLLHWRTDTQTFTEGDLDAIFNGLFNETGASAVPTAIVVDIIFSLADHCCTEPESINFENKIVLSIAIRLQAEKHMVTKIADPTFVAAIDGNQTPALFKKFKTLTPPDPAANAIIDKVLLMTPENIHLNSFMYEPILDMSDEHLRKLYSAVKTL
jgi:predicted transcriptional regulator YheO